MVTYEEKQRKSRVSKALEILKECHDSKPLGIHALDEFPNEYRVEYIGLPYIYRGVDRKLQANGIRISGFCASTSGGVHPQARAYLFLEFLGL